MRRGRCQHFTCHLQRWEETGMDVNAFSCLTQSDPPVAQAHATTHTHTHTHKQIHTSGVLNLILVNIWEISCPAEWNNCMKCRWGIFLTWQPTALNFRFSNNISVTTYLAVTVKSWSIHTLRFSHHATMSIMYTIHTYYIILKTCTLHKIKTYNFMHNEAATKMIRNAWRERSPIYLTHQVQLSVHVNKPHPERGNGGAWCMLVCLWCEAGVGVAIWGHAVF